MFFSAGTRAKIENKIMRSQKLIFRNNYRTNGSKIKKNQVNLEFVSNHNLGDELAPVIYDWMLERKGIKKDAELSRSIHLMTVGSMIGSWDFDAVIWGSGVHKLSNIAKLNSLKYIQKFDVRAVRGPITGNALRTCGHKCPEIYGDPAILMPLIFSPEKVEKKYKNSVVLHYHAGNQWGKDLKTYDNLHRLNIETVDYKTYITEMLASEKVISSSLHGIILAEAYGIPAIFLNTGGYVDEALMKYYDWYYSTERYTVKVARSLGDALDMEPMVLPNLNTMRNALIDSFPYDLWD